MFKKVIHHLGDESKISVISWMEATKCDVFQVVEVFITWNSIAILEYEFKLHQQS